MSVHAKLDERDLRYFKFVFGRAQSAPIEEFIKELGDPDIDSPQVLYQRLRSDGYPVCPVCGATPVKDEHCKPAKPRRKAKRGGGSRTELPEAAEAIPLLDPVVVSLGRYVGNLETLKETYVDERFEAVDSYESVAVFESGAVLDVEQDVPTYASVTLPRGARKHPPHELIALIAAYLIEDKPLDPLLEKLHPPATTVKRQKLETKVKELRLAARQVATLIRGGIVRTGHHPGELDLREQAAAEYITSQRTARVAEAEIDKTLLNRGFSRSDIKRLKGIPTYYPDQ